MTVTSSELYRLLVEQVRDYAIFALDPQGRVLTWNPGAERFKGYAPAEIIGRDFSVFYPSEAVEAGLPSRLLATAARVGRAEDEGWRVRKDGTRFWANVVITAIHDESGALTAFAKITRDLTERRSLEERSRQLAAEEAVHAVTASKNEELEEINRQLREQSTALEQQREEAQALAEELEQSNEELQATVAEVEEARESASAAEQFTRSILESMTDPFVVLDSEWRYQFVNDPAARMMEGSRGVPPGGLIGKNMWELYPDLTGSDFEAPMRRTAADREPTRFEAYYPRRGEWTALQCYPLPRGGIAVQWRDITDHKRAEEAAHYLARATDILSRSLDYRKTLNELAHLMVPRLADWCGVDIADERGNLQQLAVAHVNPDNVRWGIELSRRYPPPRDGATGVYHVLRTGTAELFADVTDEMLVAGAIDAEHLQLTRELGIRSVILAPIKTADRIFGVITLVAAESQRRYTDGDVQLVNELAHRAAIAMENARLHEAAIAARTQAEDANRVKMDFLATMSHELRTPLNAIGGYTSLLQLGVKGALTEEQLDFVRRIDRSGRYLLSLIQDVLSFAKLEAGRIELTLVPVAVRPLLEEMAALMLPQVREAGLDLEIAPCAADLGVQGDQERIRQILLNLVTNAVKFTPRGGRIRIQCVAGDATVRIEVHDTGMGIPSDKLEAVFEPFIQLQRTHAGAQTGTGLGLSISRDLAEAMQGTLTVRSVINEGSVFSLELARASVALE